MTEEITIITGAIYFYIVVKHAKFLLPMIALIKEKYQSFPLGSYVKIGKTLTCQDL